MMDERLEQQLQTALGGPPAEATARSRKRVRAWFAEAAPLVQWDAIPTPLGTLYVALSAEGVCSIDFGVAEAAFLASLDPAARTERNPEALAPATAQLREYFAGERARFDMPLDFSRMTPFQRTVLQTALRIPAGTVWTYGQVARAIGRPRASRAVGQALGSNPIPIVIPCHRVIGSDGSLHGYGAGSGIPSKQWLLQFEGAL
ncbi:MAG: methylated-DNA--[protein]-cysteine S-methyltransferase [Anaerolineae bacterium]